MMNVVSGEAADQQYAAQRNPWLANLPSPLRLAVGFGFFVLAYHLAYRYAMTFSHATASPFWFPDSVLLCALLLSPVARWWLFLLAPLPLRWLSGVPEGVPEWFLFATYGIDSAKGLVAATALRHLMSNPTLLQSVRDFVLFCVIAVLLVPGCAAFAGAAARHALGYDFWSTWQQWFMGNVLTQLVITPAILYWLVGIPDKFRRPDAGRLIEAGLLAVGLVSTAYFAFKIDASSSAFVAHLFYAPVPFLFWAAIRFGMSGASGAIVTLATMAVAAALDGSGPFAGKSPQETALYLQNFLLWRAAPLYLVAILVTQKTGVERHLRESEVRFRSIADFSPTFIWMSDANDRCIYANARWVQFTGRTEARHCEHWLEHVHPDDRQRCSTCYRAALVARQPLTLEYRMQRADGEYCWLLSHAVPRSTSDGTFLGYIGSCIDITEQKQARDEVHRQRMELTHAARVSTVGQLAFALAHELNQPLTAMLYNAEAGERLLRRQPLDQEELRAILADIRHDNRRAGEIIEHMRSLLKRADLQFEPLELPQLLEQVVALVRTDMLVRNIALSLAPLPDLPRVRGDRVHLQQVLLNLLINGADAMGEVPRERRRLEITVARAPGEAVEVAVSDAGHGIPGEMLMQIFEPFQSSKSGGMGLGLSICKTIIEAHGGRIWATNNAAGGATLHFTLQSADAQRQASAPVSSAQRM